MILRHYSTERITALEERPQEPDYRSFKPNGLWVSCNDQLESWPWWCSVERFRATERQFKYEVRLAHDANVPVLTTPEAIRRFGQAFKDRTLSGATYVDWNLVRGSFDGLIITPYQWDCRMDTETSWYYSWDCASGCIWRPRAISRLRMLRHGEKT